MFLNIWNLPDETRSIKVAAPIKFRNPNSKEKQSIKSKVSALGEVGI